MSQRVDVRGLSCPQPVVMAAQMVVAGHQDFDVLVDSEVSCENVRRFLTAKGYRVERSDENDGMVLHARR